MPTLSISARFCGPPRSGNGGYCCGVLGRLFKGPASVRLLSPPPLDTPLDLRCDPDALRLLQGESIVAQGREAELDIEAPEAPSLEQAQQASRHYIGFHHHPFPTCFVCGPQREEGDGLRIFPGRVEGRDLVAAPWVPAANLGDDDGTVLSEFLWSALDCTGFFAFAPLPDGAPALLGELTARIDRAPATGEPCIAIGWAIGSDGRKRFAGSALFDASGSLLAVARAIWIVMPPGSADAVT